MKNLAALILAAGQGTRMKSRKAKVLHELGGRPMICHVLEKVLLLSPERIVVVVGHQAEAVREAVARHFPNVDIGFVIQGERLGTGHAVLAAQGELSDFTGDVLIIPGDVPLMRSETLRALAEKHRDEKSELTVLSFIAQDPTCYGRILRGPGGELAGNVEERDATAAQRAIREVNSGFYVVEKGLLFRLLSKVGRANDQGEYYLTDIIALAVEDGRRCGVVILSDPAEAKGINTKADLADAAAAIRRGAFSKAP